MEHKEAVSKIKKSIARGETEKAIKLLLDYSEEIDCPSHDEVVLISGQFMKWKRENMLGIHDSSTELRRVELAIMEIIDKRLGKARQVPKKPEKETPPPPIKQQVAAPQQTPVSQPRQTDTKVGVGSQKKKSMMPLIGGVVGVGVIIIVVVWFSGLGSDSKADDLATKATISEQNVATDSSASPAKMIQPVNIPVEGDKEGRTDPETQEQERPVSSTNSSDLKASSTRNNTSSAPTASSKELTVMRNGQNLGKGEEMYSSNGNYRLVLQEDGNLMLYDNSFRPLWATRTTNGHKLTLLASGNLVLLDAGGKTVWSSKTSAAAKLTVENGGKLLLSNNRGERVWSKP